VRVYCLRDQLVAAFNTDHVVPRAFGTFEPVNPTVSCVCRDCNSYFGGNLEMFLGRDGIHAFHRLTFGIKLLAEGLAELGGDRLAFTVEAPGDWYGARLELQEEDGELLVGLVPQVALARRDGTGWTYLTESELADLKEPIPTNVEPAKGIRLFFPTPEVRERLTALLARRGINFHERGELSGPPSQDGHVFLATRFEIDSIIRRAIGKIAFNYLAWATDPGFVLSPDFDPLRLFVRYGTPTGHELVRPSNEPVLADDTTTPRQTIGHLVTVGWVGGARHLLGQVALFNDIKYEVWLARDFAGIWRDIRSGHHFDVRKRTLTPLVGASSGIVLPWRQPRRRKGRGTLR
jgi:hypothetical protein